ncbi:glycoside hydrolase family 19 protein [Beijerinckia sp. L45]|uniref:glycoside hydrolase family 19 protein n=1 Tax=Beijerinckia sp. L45 TaxID=1641855 RepID=UPI00131DDB0C|nr:glycoside hydrolase family 19 protein [Beijerinckia sp. L45]
MPISFDRKTFFDAVRSAVFHGLAAAQVAGCEALLAEAERREVTDLRFIAYMLATSFWETGRTMQPVREIGQGRGKAYGVADSATHQVYYGRGLVQLTWKANYVKMATVCGVDLVADPDRALQLDVAVKILFEGMLRGLFTGKKLGDAFNADLTDWVGARRIINGTDQAHTIAVVAQQFSTALRTALRDTPAPTTVAVERPQTFASRLKTLFGLNA